MSQVVNAVPLGGAPWVGSPGSVTNPGGGPGPGPGPGDDDPNTEDVSGISGIVDQVVKTTGVQWTDINKDGKQDLFMVGDNVSALFKNNGNGKFSQIFSQILSIALRGAVWADFDNDGDLDVAIFDPSGQTVFVTNKNGEFIVTSSPPSTGSGTLGGIWLDFNNDGLVDAYVIKDGDPNQLFKNKGKGNDEANFIFWEFTFILTGQY